MAAFRRITDRYWVAPQLGPEDIAEAKAQGFAAIVANRPDGEDAGAMTLAEAESAARAAGLAFHAIPFTMPPPPAAVESLATVLANVSGPVLGYCRTGTRSAAAWAMASARDGSLSTEEIVTAAAGAGYDLAPMAGALDALRSKA
jgi:uncharacterized protein (TIGR01244 family)